MNSSNGEHTAAVPTPAALVPSTEVSSFPPSVEGLGSTSSRCIAAALTPALALMLASVQPADTYVHYSLVDAL